MREDGLLDFVERLIYEILVDAEHAALLADLDLANIPVIEVDSPAWRAEVAAAGDLAPHAEVGAMDTFMMIFTSGTSGEPKAVQVPHIFPIFAGANLVDRFSITADDICYVSMPLFHSNAVVAGWSVALSSGASLVPAKFSASGLLEDLRREFGIAFVFIAVQTWSARRSGRRETGPVTMVGR